LVQLRIASIPPTVSQHDNAYMGVAALVLLLFCPARFVLQVSICAASPYFVAPWAQHLPSLGNGYLHKTDGAFVCMQVRSSRALVVFPGGSVRHFIE